MIKAAIFDMDGLLIDSEPLWQKAEIEVFGKVNVPLTREMCMDTMGLRIDEVVTHWHTKYPWEKISKLEVQNEVVATVIKYITETAGAMEGVYEILEFLKRKDLKIGLASSSHFAIIHAVVDKLKIKEYFSVIHSAEVEEYGKPHPAIYINAAKQIGVAPVECMALEDSFNGLLASRAARMIAVAVPEAIHFHQSRFDIAHLKLRSLKEFTNEKFQELQRMS